MPVLTKLEGHPDLGENRLDAAANVVFRGSTLLFKERGATFRVGTGTTIASCAIELGTNSVLDIGPECRISGKITVGYNSRVTIGKKLQVTRNLALRAVERTSIDIGADCLFASDISIRTADGHPIYDARTRERLNKSESIVIGDHVWLADEVLVLKAVTIGKASIIAARSVVTKSIPDNSIAAGIPARIVREGITWEHSPGLVTEDFYLSE